MVFRQLIHFIKVCRVAIERFLNEGFSYHVSALAFVTALAIVPLLLVIVFFISVFPFFSNTVQLGESYILLNFVPDSASSIEYYFRGFIQQSSRLPIVNIIFLLATAIMLVHTIEETLNDIWNVPNRKRSSKIFALLLHCLIILTLPFIIGFTVLLSSYVSLLAWLVDVPNDFLDSPEFLFLLRVLANTFMFALLYTFVPNTNVPWKNGLFAGLVAALLFEAARKGFAFYLHQFPSYALIYGAFAVIPIFLLWLYIFWLIILFCALLAYAKTKHA